MRKLFLILGLLSLSATAHAGSGTITVLDSTGATKTFDVITDGSGNFLSKIGICDQVAGANCAGVNASNQLAVAGPVTNAGTFAVQAAQSGTWNITNVSGTVSLPTGASTSALQTTINTTLGSPFQAGGSIGNTTFAATQATSSNLKAQVDPLTAASWGIGTATQNSTSATNGQLALAQFNTTPTTITTGNMSPLQMDNAGNLLVNIKAGASSGAVAQGSTTSGQTGGLNQGAVTTSAPTYTTATTNPLSMDTAGNLRVVGTGIAVGSTTSGQTGSLVFGATTTGNPTYTTAQSNPLSIDTAGGLRVNCITGCGGSGGTALADAATFTAGTTQLTPIGGQFTSGGATACVTGHSCMAGMTADRAIFANIADVGGSALALGSTTASASIPVVLASNQTAADPCMFQAKTNVPIATASGTLQLVAGVSAKKVYVCSLSLVAPSAVSVSLSEGSAANCATSAQAGVIGVATNGTAANGIPLAANGGLTLGNGGGTIAATATAANFLCLFQSGTVQLAGNMTYVQQ